MKSLFSILFVMFILPLTLIAQNEKSVCPAESAVSDSADAIILIVCHHSGGMSAVPRTRLYLRLYESGRVEYEVSPIYDKPVIKEAKADAAEVAEIVKLGRQSDFQKARTEYPRFQIRTDSGLKTPLIFKDGSSEKKIVVNNYSAYDKKNDEHYLGVPSEDAAKD